jgi:hypothetical protein
VRSKLARAIAALTLLAVMSGCGNSGATDARLTKLERRVSKLERENAELRAAQATDRVKARAAAAALVANDDALYTGLSMAQFGAVCRFH